MIVKIMFPVRTKTTPNPFVRIIGSLIMPPFSTTWTAPSQSPKTGKVSKSAFYLENAMAFASSNVEADVLSMMVARKLSFRSLSIP